jgi:hypothetical protein
LARAIDVYVLTAPQFISPRQAAGHQHPAHPTRCTMAAHWRAGSAPLRLRQRSYATHRRVVLGALLEGDAD